jgi:hypothetical protein
VDENSAKRCCAVNYRLFSPLSKLTDAGVKETTLFENAFSNGVQSFTGAKSKASTSAIFLARNSGLLAAIQNLVHVYKNLLLAHIHSTYLVSTRGPFQQLLRQQ